MCTHQAHDDEHTTGTKIDFFVWCAFCVPHVCRYFCNPCLSKIRKVLTISCRMSTVAQKLDICSALWLNLKFENIFEKNRKFWNFFFKLKNLDFSENFEIFTIEPQGARDVRFLPYGAHSTGNCLNFSNFTQTWVVKLSAHMWHTTGTSCEKCDFCTCVCTSTCAWCVHMYGGARHLKVRRHAVPTPCPDLKSYTNSPL